MVMVAMIINDGVKELGVGIFLLKPSETGVMFLMKFFQLQYKAEIQAQVDSFANLSTARHLFQQYLGPPFLRE